MGLGHLQSKRRQLSLGAQVARWGLAGHFSQGHGPQANCESKRFREFGDASLADAPASDAKEAAYSVVQ